MIGVNEKLSITRQCQLLDLSRSGFYYQPEAVSDLNDRMMKLIDEIYTDNPDFGSRQIRNALKRNGHKVNRKRIQRLMQIMGLQAIYPGRNLSKPGIGSEHKIFPYLLRNLKIERPNQVWSTDITYIRLHHGFIYLVAVMDWYSRKVLSWEISTTMDHSFCVSCLERAILKYGKPEILNSDQGSQFTCKEYRKTVLDKDILFSMDGKGRALDNIVIERFWRTLKYGEVYLKDYRNPVEASAEISRYIEKYNLKRPHTSLNYHTPDEVYFHVMESQNQTKKLEKVS
jgi:putative transposase